MTKGENFPVGSLLIRRDLREVVRVFYAFARAADDVADDPVLAPAEKLRRLDLFEAGLDGDPTGVNEGRDLASLPAPEPGRHARRLLRAFRWDAVAGRCATWGELLDYCADSANPVGRFLLDLHREDPAGRAPSDRLCTALQILNHLQDLKEDHLRLGRRYLPADWMAEEGATEADLAGASMTPALRRVVDRALDGCDGLLDGAEDLPSVIASRRLAGEAATILHLARSLSRRLRHGDPLAARIRPSRLDFARAGALGVRVALRRRPSAWDATAPGRRA